MAKILLRKRLDGSLYPMDEEAEGVLKRCKAGRDVWCEIRVARNPKHHRLYFGLLSLAYSNLPERYAAIWATPEKFRKMVELEAGHSEDVTDRHGVIHAVPKSIAWDAMDQLEFDTLFPRVMGICADILRMESSELANELERYAA